jgi:hypothetical protein
MEADVSVNGTVYKRAQGKLGCGGRSAVFFFLASFVAMAVSGASAAARTRKRKRPQVTVRMPSVRGPWQPTTVRIRVHNPTAKHLIPLALRLQSKAQTLAYWGYKAPSRKWVIRRRAQKSKNSYKVITPTRMSQRALPHNRRVASNAVLALIEPLQAGESMTLSHVFQATYSHGGRLRATFTYRTLDPKRLHVCQTAMRKSPTAGGKLIPCQRTRRLNKQTFKMFLIYVPFESLAVSNRSVSAEARFKVRRPRFRLSRARRKAGLAKGAVGYLRKRSSWVLVNAAGGRTVICGRHQKTNLPGNWLAMLMRFNTVQKQTIRWSARTPKAARRIYAALRRKGFGVGFFHFKGHRSSKRLLIRLSLAQIEVLARFMRKSGCHLEGRAVHC